MKNSYNRFFLFFSALIPGAGYMYLGLMRRGAEAMIMFAAGIAIPAWIGMPALATIIAIPLWFYCFFDSFYQRANLETGLEIADRGLIDLQTWFADNYHLVGICLIGLGVLALVNSIGQELIYSANVIVKEITRHLRGYLPPLLLIIAGIYLLRRNHRQTPDTINSKEDVFPSEARSVNGVNVDEPPTNEPTPPAKSEDSDNLLV
ncbi:MAG: hypothetical protein ACM3NT_03720 [Methylocystaceae bacterium]